LVPAGLLLGLAAIVAGTIIGCFRWPCLSPGPRPARQLPLARAASARRFSARHRAWLSSISWDSLVGRSAVRPPSSVSIPFWVPAPRSCLASQAVVSIYGYEFVHRLQAIVSAILIVPVPRAEPCGFFQHHVRAASLNTAHGGALLGSFA